MHDARPVRSWIATTLLVLAWTGAVVGGLSLLVAVGECFGDAHSSDWIAWTIVGVNCLVSALVLAWMEAVLAHLSALRHHFIGGSPTPAPAPDPRSAPTAPRSWMVSFIDADGSVKRRPVEAATADQAAERVRVCGYDVVSVE